MAPRASSKASPLTATERAAAVGLVANWVAHDLAQPLHAMAIVLDNLEAALGPDADEGLQAKVQLCQEQIGLAGDFLALLRAVGRDARPGPSATDLAGTLDRALKLLAPRLALAGVRVEGRPHADGTLVEVPETDLLLLLTQVLEMAAGMATKGQVLSIRGDCVGNGPRGDRVRMTLSWAGGAEPDGLRSDLAGRLAQAAGGALGVEREAAGHRLVLDLPAQSHGC